MGSIFESVIAWSLAPLTALFVYDSEVVKVTKYLDSQYSAYSNRVRIITTSENEAAPAIFPTNPIEIFAYLDKCFKLRVTKEGHTISKPSWIIEGQLNGDVSLACSVASQRSLRRPYS